MRRIFIALALASALVAPPALATTLPSFTYGFDLDQVSQPRFTQAGFGSVTQCTLSPGQPTPPACQSFAEFPPSGQPGAGYLASARAPQDFRVLPLADASAPPDLWGDGHRVLPGAFAVLRISDLPAGHYFVYLFSADPNPTSTRFQLNGQDVGVVTGSSSDPDLGTTGTLVTSVDIDASGILDVRYSGDGFRFGTLNGVALAIPEPPSAILVAAGVLALGVRRRRATPCGSQRDWQRTAERPVFE